LSLDISLSAGHPCQRTRVAALQLICVNISSNTLTHQGYLCSPNLRMWC